MWYFEDSIDYAGDTYEKIDFQRYCQYSENPLIDQHDYRLEFRGASLKFSKFKYIYLRRANFSGADLFRADFYGADLYEANFSGAKIQGTNFTECEHLKTANWKGATYDKDTEPRDFFEKSEAKFRPRRQSIIRSPRNNEQKVIDQLTESLEYRQSQGRKGQQKLRRELLELCKYCCITRCSFEPVLEAAHIEPYSRCDKRDKTNPKNALLLRADVHTLFDLNLIKINPYNFKIEVDSRLSLIDEYYQFNGEQALLNIHDLLLKGFLEWRYNNYQKYIEQYVKQNINYPT